MKARLLALSLGAALALTGCSAMLERSHVTTTTHLDYSVAEDPSILRVESYQALVNALLYYVNQHSTTGTLRLYNYTGDVEADLASACNEVMTKDPLGVFSVAEMEYDSTRILTYYEVQVRISYSRSAQTVSSIQPVSGLSGLRSELLQAITATQSQSITRVSYFSGNAQLVESLFWMVYYSAPQLVRTPPQITVSLYPATGPQRIVEVGLTWLDQPTDTTAYAQAVEASVQNHLRRFPDQTPTVETLVEWMRQTSVSSPTGSGSALHALMGQPADNQGLLLGLEALLQGAGLEASMVLGHQNGIPHMWLIVSTSQGYRHLLVSSLQQNQPLTMYTDAQLTALGFTWTTSLYPACRESMESATS